MGGGAPGVEREAQLGLHTQPAADEQPRQYVSASSVLRPLRYVLLCCDVNPAPTPGRPRARALPRMRSASGGGTGRAVVDEGGTTRSTHADDRRPPEADERRPRRARTGDSAAPEAARAVSSCPLPLLLALVRVVSPIGEGPPEASVHN
ncbi:hypothetical protein EVAR_15119_1 [Eumeta japonica]|uniref:Uncharacterized protein n=1 Tax=Eumeta variegata TaxID=151549 RepID=A0A4C1UJH3_EUMVA|nr:hypothetical protein EVAR_15119_1 [Eumeta japonica]